MPAPGAALHPALPRLAAGIIETRPLVPGYEIREVLGRGGMGVVYKAHQIKLNRIVALKMILAGEHAGPLQLRRFHREGEAAAQLQHPHIVQIYEVGAQAGRPYFVLEYVDGGSLDQHLLGTPQAPRAAAQLLETLAQAVHYAHESGVVHRDLKPANVLLQLARGDKSTPLASILETAVPKLTDSAWPSG